MLLLPKNTKYRKEQKGISNKQKQGYKKGLNKIQLGYSKANRLSYGCYGLKTLDTCHKNRITAGQIEAVRKVIIRDIRKIGKIWIRIFPSKPITSKPTKTRMGKGKGSVQYWVASIKPGQIIIEISAGITEDLAKEILKKAAQKLPIATKFVSYNTANRIMKC